VTLEDLIEDASRIFEDAPAGSTLEELAGKVLSYTETVDDLVNRYAVRDALRNLLEGDGYRRALGRDQLKALGVLP
jgi:hypothetical protein